MRDTLEETAAEIRKKTGAEVLAVPADVSQPDQVSALIAKAIDQFGGIDILVSNAGGPRAGRFADLSPEDYQTALHLNLLSTINLCRGVVPSMKARGGGRIINLTSISVKQPVDGLMLSNMARTGVIGFAKTLASELAPDNILINNVCPGIIFTDRIKQLATVRAEEAGITYEEALENMTQDIPLGSDWRSQGIRQSRCVPRLRTAQVISPAPQSRWMAVWQRGCYNCENRANR